MIELKKINIVKKNIEFARIIKENNSYKTSPYIIYIERTNESRFHFGISVSKKLGNAVIRNKIKRQIKNIIDKKDYKNNFNCIIIVRKEFLSNSFSENENVLLNTFKRFKIFKEDTKKKKKNYNFISCTFNFYRLY